MNIVWFNGPSANFLIRTLPQQQIEIGCNFIYLERRVQHVVCYDHQMLDRIEFHPSYRVWCRNGTKHPQATEVNYTMRQQPHNSGVMALRLAINLKLDHVFVLGCDWGITNKSIFDYDDRNSELKYTNSQKKLVKQMQDEIDMTFVNANSIDIACHRISPDTFLNDVNRSR